MIEKGRDRETADGDDSVDGVYDTVLVDTEAAGLVRCAMVRGLGWVGSDGAERDGMECVVLVWCGLCWVGVRWCGLCWCGLGWGGLRWVGLVWVALRWVGLGASPG